MDVEASYEGLREMEVLQTIKITTHHHKSPEFIPPSETQARQDDILPFGKTEKRRVYAGKAPPNPGWRENNTIRVREYLERRKVAQATSRKTPTWNHRHQN